MKLKNKVLKIEPIDWRSCQWIQPKSLKELSPKSMEKLISSILENDIIAPFLVWETKGNIYILDGHHRQKALEEIEKRKQENQNIPEIPDRLPGVFIECKNKRDAAKICLAHSSSYAKIQEQGLSDMIKEYEIDFKDLKNYIDLPGINIDEFEATFINGSDLDVIETDDLLNSGIAHFYSGSSTAFRIGDMICYITEDGLREKINAFVERILAVEKDQKYLNEIGTKILKDVLKNETLYTQ